MKRICREIAGPMWRTRQLAARELLRHATIVTDPDRLAYLNAKVVRQKARTEIDGLRVRSQMGPQHGSSVRLDSSCLTLQSWVQDAN